MKFRAACWLVAAAILQGVNGDFLRGKNDRNLGAAVRFLGETVHEDTESQMMADEQIESAQIQKAAEQAIAAVKKQETEEEEALQSEYLANEALAQAKQEADEQEADKEEAEAAHYGPYQDPILTEGYEAPNDANKEEGGYAPMGSAEEVADQMEEDGIGQGTEQSNGLVIVGGGEKQDMMDDQEAAEQMALTGKEGTEQRGSDYGPLGESVEEVHDAGSAALEDLGPPDDGPHQEMSDQETMIELDQERLYGYVGPPGKMGEEEPMEGDAQNTAEEDALEEQAMESGKQMEQSQTGAEDGM